MYAEFNLQIVMLHFTGLILHKKYYFIKVPEYNTIAFISISCKFSLNSNIIDFSIQEIA